MPPLSKSIMPPSTARLQIAHRGLRLAFAAVRQRQAPRDCEGGDTGTRIMADRIARSSPPGGLTIHLCLRVGEQVRSSPPEGVDLHGSCDRKIRGRSTPPEGVDREEER